MAPPALCSLPDLPQALRELLAQIPRGQVTTFGDLAKALGDIAAARWVAEWLREQWLLETAPINGHRVVLRSGDLPAWFDDRRTWQCSLLQADAVPMVSPTRVDVAAHWSAFVSEHPLQQLRTWQAEIVTKAVWPPWPDIPKIIGGVDLSYASASTAVAAYVAVEVATGTVVFEHTVTAATPFPYLPGYLTFRELPPLLTLLNDVRQRTTLAPVILVDGTGRLHPRQAGLAVALGVCAECVTVGVSKHQLCGQVHHEDCLSGCPTIWQNEACLGAEMTIGLKRRTAYVSSGTGLDLPAAVRMVAAVWNAERSPRPIARADALSRAVARTLKSS